MNRHPPGCGPNSFSDIPRARPSADRLPTIPRNPTNNLYTTTRLDPELSSLPGLDAVLAGLEDLLPVGDNPYAQRSFDGACDSLAYLFVQHVQNSQEAIRKQFIDRRRATAAATAAAARPSPPSQPPRRRVASTSRRQSAIVSSDDEQQDSPQPHTQVPNETPHHSASRRRTSSRRPSITTAKQEPTPVSSPPSRRDNSTSDSDSSPERMPVYRRRSQRSQRSHRPSTPPRKLRSRDGRQSLHEDDVFSRAIAPRASVRNAQRDSSGPEAVPNTDNVAQSGSSSDSSSSSEDEQTRLPVVRPRKYAARACLVSDYTSLTPNFYQDDEGTSTEDERRARARRTRRPIVADTECAQGDPPVSAEALLRAFKRRLRTDSCYSIPLTYSGTPSVLSLSKLSNGMYPLHFRNACAAIAEHCNIHPFANNIMLRPFDDDEDEPKPSLDVLTRQALQENASKPDPSDSYVDPALELLEADVSTLRVIESFLDEHETPVLQSTPEKQLSEEAASVSNLSEFPRKDSTAIRAEKSSEVPGHVEDMQTHVRSRMTASSPGLRKSAFVQEDVDVDVNPIAEKKPVTKLNTNPSAQFSTNSEHASEGNKSSPSLAMSPGKSNKKVKDVERLIAVSPTKNKGMLSDAKTQDAGVEAVEDTVNSDVDKLSRPLSAPKRARSTGNSTDKEGAQATPGGVSMRPAHVISNATTSGKQETPCMSLERTPSASNLPDDVMEDLAIPDVLLEDAVGGDALKQDLRKGVANIDRESFADSDPPSAVQNDVIADGNEFPETGDSERKSKPPTMDREISNDVLESSAPNSRLNQKNLPFKVMGKDGGDGSRDPDLQSLFNDSQESEAENEKGASADDDSNSATMRTKRNEDFSADGELQKGQDTPFSPSLASRKESPAKQNVKHDMTDIREDSKQYRRVRKGTYGVNLGESSDEYCSDAPGTSSDKRLSRAAPACDKQDREHATASDGRKPGVQRPHGNSKPIRSISNLSDTGVAKPVEGGEEVDSCVDDTPHSDNSGRSSARAKKKRAVNVNSDKNERLSPEANKAGRVHAMNGQEGNCAEDVEKDSKAGVKKWSTTPGSDDDECNNSNKEIKSHSIGKGSLKANKQSARERETTGTKDLDKNAKNKVGLSRLGVQKNGIGIKKPRAANGLSGTHTSRVVKTSRVEMTSKVTHADLVEAKERRKLEREIRDYQRAMRMGSLIDPVQAGKDRTGPSKRARIERDTTETDPSGAHAPRKGNKDRSAGLDNGDASVNSMERGRNDKVATPGHRERTKIIDSDIDDIEPSRSEKDGTPGKRLRTNVDSSMLKMGSGAVNADGDSAVKRQRVEHVDHNGYARTVERTNNEQGDVRDFEPQDEPPQLMKGERGRTSTSRKSLGNSPADTGRGRGSARGVNGHDARESGHERGRGQLRNRHVRGLHTFGCGPEEQPTSSVESIGVFGATHRSAGLGSGAIPTGPNRSMPMGPRGPMPMGPTGSISMLASGSMLMRTTGPGMMGRGGPAAAGPMGTMDPMAALLAQAVAQGGATGGMGAISPEQIQLVKEHYNRIYQTEYNNERRKAEEEICRDGHERDGRGRGQGAQPL